MVVLVFGRNPFFGGLLLQFSALPFTINYMRFSIKCDEILQYNKYRNGKIRLCYFLFIHVLGQKIRGLCFRMIVLCVLITLLLNNS